MKKIDWMFRNSDDKNIEALIDSCYKGKRVSLPAIKHVAELKMLKDQVRRANITLIWAAYQRSAAIFESGEVYIWGMGFRNENLTKPILLFKDG